MADLDTIATLIQPHLDEMGLELVRVRLFEGEERTLQIMAERPDTGQLTIPDCTALSHAISDAFDALEAEGRDPVPGAYRLEVSSPGIDRPLTRLKDFADWAGHEARVTLANAADAADGSARKNLAGTLAGVEGESIAFDDRKAGRLSFALADVAEAKLTLTDKLLAATAPLDATGADETLEIDSTED